jgi:hypothetical protein
MNPRDATELSQQAGGEPPAGTLSVLGNGPV